MAVAWPEPASREVSEPRHPAAATGNVAYCELDRVLDRLGVLIISEAPNDDELLRPFDADVRGLPVSLRGFLQNIHIESLVSQEFLQASILFLKGFQFLRHLWFHPSVLLAPAIVSLLRDIESLADLWNLLPLPSSTSA